MSPKDFIVSPHKYYPGCGHLGSRKFARKNYRTFFNATLEPD
ncbi:hypothetical protein OCEANICA350_11669 [Oceanicaulis sp. 350]|nr:hypothetical protein OCEANICA350_11669 [Oceanicaulis sp. 350]